MNLSTLQSDCIERRTPSFSVHDLVNARVSTKIRHYRKILLILTYRKPSSPTTPAANQPFTSNVNAAGAAFPVYGLGNVVDLVGAFVVPVEVMPSHTSHSVTVAVDFQVPFMVLFHGIALELDIGA
jgi:hypothetical protein